MHPRGRRRNSERRGGLREIVSINHVGYGHTGPHTVSVRRTVFLGALEPRNQPDLDQYGVPHVRLDKRFFKFFFPYFAPNQIPTF